jgi:hypothetical protein
MPVALIGGGLLLGGLVLYFVLRKPKPAPKPMLPATTTKKNRRRKIRRNAKIVPRESIEDILDVYGYPELRREIIDAYPSKFAIRRVTSHLPREENVEAMEYELLRLV